MSTWGEVMVRLGASVEENARATLEDIMGTPNGAAQHKPSRPDIQKMRDVWNLYNAAAINRTAPVDHEEQRAERLQAAKEWQEKYELDDREEQLVRRYQNLIQAAGFTPDRAFEQIVYVLTNYGNYIESEFGADTSPYKDIKGDESAAKKLLGGALKKYEQQGWPRLFETISRALDDAYRRDPSSYKLWPWMVKQIKASYENWLKYWNKRANFDYQSRLWNEIGAGHILDITVEGGALLSKLRAENKIPQNFDINQLGVGDFEEWLMEWKKENVESEQQGEVVYEFHDGWTIQRLMTPEQLQYEGDEMGHCVGGYTHEVEDGTAIIYSLRDDKGRPHVTMEIEGMEAYMRADQHPGTQGYDSVEDALRENAIDSTEIKDSSGDRRPYVMEMLSPTDHAPGEHTQSKGIGPDREVAWGKTGPKPFEVIQIQGNGNSTPKPEYQRKIREFLDFLRSKGWNFVRSENWYGNEDGDEEGYDTAEDYRIKDASTLDDWWDEHYRPYYDLYQKGGEDAYGMQANRIYPSIADWDEVMLECAASLIDDYDRDRWKTSNWQQLAQMVYHAWMLETDHANPSPDLLQAYKESFEKAIERAEEKVQDWTWESEYYWDEGGMREEVNDLYEQKGGKFEEDEDEDEEFTVYNPDPDKTPLDEALYEECRDEIRGNYEDAYAGNAYRFFGYLLRLLDHQGAVGPGDLPDPHERHGGLPSYEDLVEKGWTSERTPVEKGIEGTLSSVHWAEVATPVMPDLNYVLDYEPTENQDWGWQAHAIWWTDKPEWKDHTQRSNEMFADSEMWPHSEFPKGIYSPAGITWKQAQQYLLDRCGAEPWKSQIANATPNEPFLTRSDCHEWAIEKVDASHFSHRLAIVDIGKCATCGGSVGADGYCMQCGRFNDEYWRPQRVPRFQQGMPQQQQSEWQSYQPETEKIPGTFASFNPDEIQIHPIDKEHNVWFDEEGNERTRYRLNWAKDPATGKWGEVPGQDWDSFLDKQGRQGQGYVAYHGDRPVASLTYVDDPAGWYMLGTAYTHPDYREQGLFNRLVQPLRDTGKPIDAYVWNNPWLKNKVRDWRMPKTSAEHPEEEQLSWAEQRRRNEALRRTLPAPTVHLVNNDGTYEYSHEDEPDYGLPFLFHQPSNTVWVGTEPTFHNDIEDALYNEESGESGIPYDTVHGRYNHLRHEPSEGYTSLWYSLSPDAQRAIEGEIKKLHPEQQIFPPHPADEEEDWDEIFQ